MLWKQPGHTRNGHCAVVALVQQAVSSRLPLAGKERACCLACGPPDLRPPASLQTFGVQSPCAGIRPHSSASGAAASDSRQDVPRPDVGRLLPKPAKQILLLPGLHDKHWRLREVELFRVTQSVGSQARITGPACGDEKPERAGLNPGDLWGEDTHRQQVGILSPPGGSSSLFRSAILLGCRVPASRGTLSRHPQTRGPDSSDLWMARRVGRSVWQGTRPAFPTIYRAETARFPRPPTRPCTLIPRSPQPHRRPSAPPQQTPLPEL